MRTIENQETSMKNKGQVRKMKENQWKTQGKASQTEKQQKSQNKTKTIPKKNPSPLCSIKQAFAQCFVVRVGKRICFGGESVAKTFFTKDKTKGRKRFAKENRDSFRENRPR